MHAHIRSAGDAALFVVQVIKQMRHFTMIRSTLISIVDRMMHRMNDMDIQMNYSGCSKTMEPLILNYWELTYP